MSTSDSIVSSQTKQSSWRKSDTTWTLGLFGTAIGAGVLFFPIRAGFGGLIPILLMLVLAYPIAFYCHRALARLCLSGSNPSGNITETVEEHFGKTGGVVITFLYFFAICPLLWIYGVTITNTFMTFWENQLGFAPLNRGFVALFLLLLMAFVIWFGKDLMVKVMSYLVWPFIATVPQLQKWSRARIDDRIDELMALLGLEPNLRERYPHQLSGGQQQRVGVARALAADPQVLLMDEPFGALDPVTRGALQQEMTRIHRLLGRTIVLVTHDIDEALRLAEHLVLMDHGEVVQQGNPLTMLTRPANDFVRQFFGRSELGVRLLSLRSVADYVRREERADGEALAEEMTLRDALSLFVARGCEVLPVVNMQGQPCGTLHFQDLLVEA